LKISLPRPGTITDLFGNNVLRKSPDEFLLEMAAHETRTFVIDFNPTNSGGK